MRGRRGTRASPPLFCQQHPWQIAKFFLTHLLFKSSHPKIKYVRIVQPIKLIGYVFIPWIVLPIMHQNNLGYTSSFDFFFLIFFLPFEAFTSLNLMLQRLFQINNYIWTTRIEIQYFMFIYGKKKKLKI